MTIWLIRFTLASILLQSGCAAFSITRTGEVGKRRVPVSQSIPPPQHTHQFHYLSDTGLDSVEITMSGFVGGGHSTQIGLRHDAAESSEQFTRSGDVQHGGKSTRTSTHIATMPARTPEYAGKWLAVEKNIWSSAYAQGQIHHESIGRRYRQETDDNYAQHAIRQTVKVQLSPDIQCMARRKFYSEAFGFGTDHAQHYVRRFRERSGLKQKAPFGIESDSIKDQVYLVKRDLSETEQRIELHRVYTIAGASPNELVETSFLCTGPILNIDTLGQFNFHWLTQEKRMGVNFRPHQRPRVQALKSHRHEPTAKLDPNDSSAGQN